MPNISCPFGFRLLLVIPFATSLQFKEAHMATKRSGSTTIVAIIVILIIAVGAYFVFAANDAGGGGVQPTLGVSTLPVMDPTTAPY
jgi:hypothetical protein